MKLPFYFRWRWPFFIRLKWPKSITLVRHGQSAYNILRVRKDRDADYFEFKKEYETDYQSHKAKLLAIKMQAKYSLGVSDEKTPLTPEGEIQARETGRGLSKKIALPDVVIVSPYLRTMQTLNFMQEGWLELKKVKVVLDERIIEQDHGRSLLYNDWRIMHILFPEEKKLYDLVGLFHYRFPNGESILNVKDRCREEISMLIREYSNKNVLLVTHHLTILSFRAILERLSPEEFIKLDKFERPSNCGVTQYIGNPNFGKNGHLELKSYNKVFY